MNTPEAQRIDVFLSYARWRKAADDLILYAREYQQRFVELFTRLREQQLPDRLRVAMQEAANRMTVNMRNQAEGEDDDELGDTQTGEAMAWAVRHAVYDRDPYFRDLLHWFLQHVARASTVEEAMSGLMQRVINSVYGEKIF